MSLFSLIGAGLSTLSNVYSANKGADALLQAQREANEANIALSREQMAYQTSEREAMQDYNTPLNQRQRYVQAGINPYMMLSNMNAGNTEMQSGVQPAHVEPAVDNATGASIGALGDSLASGLDAYVRQRQSLEMADSISMDNRLKSITLQNEGVRQMLELENKRSEIQNKRMDSSVKQRTLDEIDERIEALSIQNQHLDEYWSAHSRKEREEADLRHNERVLTSLKSTYQRKINRLYEKFTNAQIAQMKAATNEAFSRIDLNSKMGIKAEKEAAKLVTEELTERARKYGIEVDNTWKADMYDANLNYIQATAHKVHNTDNVVQNWIAPFAGAVGAGSIGAALLK